ncbi:MAG: GMP/IMP nucleotidase [Gammaproteobacteria bacterium]|nr:GMP/IMP nucleotidase [Gammaproteobacteria bacterium]
MELHPSSAPVSWSDVRTVLLDMDGTLLDLHFDDYFWSEHIPLRYAERKGIALMEARQELEPHFRRMEGTIQWYCVDYWSDVLGLDVALLKREVEHLIGVHPHVIGFLQALRRSGRRVVLVTNAHMKSLGLKMERTRLAGHFDSIVCSHEFGQPKESQGFWALLNAREVFEPQRTLLVDDSLPVLRAARDYGVRHLLAVSRPSSRRPARTVADFPAIQTFAEVMPIAGDPSP